jgi:hypothetical protein
MLSALAKYVINSNFNPTINVLYDILVGLKLLITKGREQVPVVQSKFELIFTYNKATIDN